MCIYLCLKCPWRPEEGTSSLAARVTGMCELPDMGAGYQAQFSSLQKQKVPTWPPILCTQIDKYWCQLNAGGICYIALPWWLTQTSSWISIDHFSWSVSERFIVSCPLHSLFSDSFYSLVFFLCFYFPPDHAELSIYPLVNMKYGQNMHWLASLHCNEQISYRSHMVEKMWIWAHGFREISDLHYREDSWATFLFGGRTGELQFVHMVTNW